MGEEFVSDTEKLNILPNDIAKEEPYVAENIVDVERFRRDTLLGNLIRNTGREADKLLKGFFAAGKKAKSKKKKAKKKKSKKSNGYFNEYDQGIGGGRRPYFNDYTRGSYGYFNEHDRRNGQHR